MSAQQNQQAKPYTFRKFGNTFVVSVENHMEIARAIMDFCHDMNLTAGVISGIGAINQATLRFYNPATRQYVDRTFDEQMELANLTGNISVMDGRPYTHIHCVLGRADYSALAGHLLSARINGACELVVTAFDSPLDRRHDNVTGLNLYDF